MAENFKDHGTNIINVSGLTFKVEVDDSAFAVLGLWEGQELSLVRGTIVPFEDGTNEFIIDSFFFEGSNSFSAYYEEISKIAKARKRTVAGIVMEIIKDTMTKGSHLSVGGDSWRGAQGPTILESSSLKLAARELLGKANEEEYDLEEAKAYLETRYGRLFPTAKMSREDFLRNIENRGWYGAWLPNFSTEKTDVITTAVRP